MVDFESPSPSPFCFCWAIPFSVFSVYYRLDFMDVFIYDSCSLSMSQNTFLYYSPHLSLHTGLLHAEDGDVLFARPIGGDTQGVDDSLQLMAFGKWVYILCLTPISYI